MCFLAGILKVLTAGTQGKTLGQMNRPVLLEDSLWTDTSCLFLFSISASS